MLKRQRHRFYHVLITALRNDTIQCGRRPTPISQRAIECRMKSFVPRSQEAVDDRYAATLIDQQELRAKVKTRPDFDNPLSRKGNALLRKLLHM